MRTTTLPLGRVSKGPRLSQLLPLLMMMMLRRMRPWDALSRTAGAFSSLATCTHRCCCNHHRHSVQRNCCCCCHLDSHHQLRHCDMSTMKTTIPRMRVAPRDGHPGYYYYYYYCCHPNCHRHWKRNRHRPPRPRSMRTAISSADRTGTGV